MQDIISQIQKNFGVKRADNFESVDAKTINNLRMDIIGEFEAINQYTEHMNQSTNRQLRAVWESIREEEQVHVGELMNMLFKFDPQSYEQFQKGIEESNDLISKM